MTRAAATGARKQMQKKQAFHIWALHKNGGEMKPHALTHSLARSFAHSRTHTTSLSPSLPLSLPLALYLSLSRARSLSLSLSLTHTPLGLPWYRITKVICAF